MNNGKSLPQELIDATADVLSKAYDCGFLAGATAERQRIAAVFAGGALVGVVGPTEGAAPKAARKVKTKSPKLNADGTPKERKNPWAALTPEQRATRIEALRAGQKKRWAKQGDGTSSPDTPPVDESPTPVVDVSADVPATEPEPVTETV